MRTPAVLDGLVRSTICRTGWTRFGYVTRMTWLRSCYRGQLCQVRDYIGSFSRPTPLPAQRQFRFQQDAKHSKSVRQHQLRCHSPVSRPRSGSLRAFSRVSPQNGGKLRCSLGINHHMKPSSCLFSGHKPQALQFTRRLVFFRATEEMMEDYYAREGGMSNWSKTDKM